MLGEENKDRPSNRRTFLRSVSWTDRSPVNRNPKPQTNNKTRSCLPPLSVSRKSVEEWPKAGSDDLGVWPHPPTPGAFGSKKPLDNSDPKQPPPREFQLKKDKLAFFDKECSRIADHVYLGSDAVAKNREILRQNGITHVLNCVGFVSPEYFKSDLVYKTLWLQDTPSEDITSILYDVFDYFEDVREQGGRVFVHCCQGVSRSTSLVIAYLMWREGQSFEDAFQFVKAARGVTNPNMGFACQLLQCQKRVHAVPASPNSVLRMYRMAPHSPYDPLHLVPKMVNHPGAQGLDSRGAFVVHVPSAIYVWIGKNCMPVMSDTASGAASQVIRYESAQGPVVTIKEGEELCEFWDALANGQLLPDNCSGKAVSDMDGVGQRKVDEYDQDFEVFHKALAGGVVPPLPLSGTGCETCLPARENGWHRLRRKLPMIKELITSSKLSCDAATQSSHGPYINISIDTRREVESPVSPTDPMLSSSPQCGSPDSFSCYPICGPDSIMDTSDVEQSVPYTNPSLSSTPCASPDSFSSFPINSPKFSSKSPLISPSTSDYSSSFTFSPSSSNWSDLSFLSSQSSPSGLESADRYPAKNASLAENACLLCKGTSPSLTEACSANHALRMGNTCLPCKGISPSIAERRGSNPPPPMMLPSVDEASQVPQNLVRSWSFSLPDLEDDMMMDVESNQCEQEGLYELNIEEQILDADIFSAGDKFQSGNEAKLEFNTFHIPSSDTTDTVAEVFKPVLYQWPTMDKVEMDCFGILDSRSVYIILMPDVSLGTNKPDVLYIWLGHDFSCEEGRSQLIGSDDSHVHWETVGRKFLNQMGLPLNSPVQIVKEGEEPKQLLKHLNYFSFPKA
uniref:Putative Mitogen-activated protein kinase phosphatase 1 isoform 2 n=1 Tax=Davidia involucrata TaxID=16924 RepID=A0A5B6YHI7_DAVIN